MSDNDHDKDRDEKDVCPVCLGPQTIPYRLVNCAHTFCKNCLTEVRKQMKNDPRCPYCRTISFLALSTIGLGTINLGHPSEKRMEELKLSKESIVAAMVCVNCHTRDDPERLVQCEECHALWHDICAVEPIMDTRDPETGQPLSWVCAGCTASSRANSAEVKAAAKKFFADRARAARAKFQEAPAAAAGGEDEGGASAAASSKQKGRGKKRPASGGGGGGGGSGAAGADEIRYSGKHLSASSSRGRAFFNPKKNGSSAASAAAVPRSSSSSSRSPADDDDATENANADDDPIEIDDD